MNLRKPPIGKQIEEYRSDLESSGYSPESIRSYVRICEAWAGSGLTPIQYVSSLHAEMKSNSVYAYRSGLKTFFSWRLKRGYVRDNPLAQMKSPRAEQTITRSLSTNEVARLLAGCDELGKNYDIGDDGSNLGRLPVEVYRARLAAMAALQVSSGIRLGELLKLKDTDIDLRARKGIVYGKGRKERAVRFSLPAKRYIQAWLEMRDRHLKDAALHLFCSSTGRMIDPAVYRKQLADAAWWAGLGNVHPHLLRHTFATRMSEAGVPVQKLQLMMGHTQVVTTMRYIHEKEARDAWKLASEIPDGLDEAVGREEVPLS